MATLGLPDSPGVPKAFAQHTLSLDYNNPDALDVLFKEQGDQVAAVILEPVAGNMGVVPPTPEFLARLRSLTEKHGALLVFDEVMTGFRVHPKSAQGLFQIEPDLSCFGKVIGGGMPLGAYGGRADVMQQIAPAGPVYQAGTLSGNPCAVAAGLATLKGLTPEVYQTLETQSAKLEAGLRSALEQNQLPGVVQRVGAMITVFFTEADQVQNFDDATAADHERFGRFFRAMLKQGVYLPASGYEAWFVSAAHSNADLDATIGAAKSAMAES